MARKRKGLSQRIRFEVFKRDSFTCQYCGKAAPEVVLEVDHIAPVAKGGLDDMLNLLTACRTCNGGKSDVELSDDSALKRQLSQLEELQERKQQLEMMMEWRKGLDDLEQQSLEMAAQYWRDLCDDRYYLNEDGLRTLKKLLSQFGLQKVLAAMRKSADSYFRRDEEGVTKESLDVAWNRVTGMLKVDKAAETDPHARDIAYILGILRNRFEDDVVTWVAKKLLRRAYDLRFTDDYLKSHAKTASSFGAWESQTVRNIAAAEREDAEDEG